MLRSSYYVYGGAIRNHRCAIELNPLLYNLCRHCKSKSVNSPEDDNNVLLYMHQVLGLCGSLPETNQNKITST